MLFEYWSLYSGRSHKYKQMIPFQISEHKGDTISRPLLRIFKVKVDGIWQAEHLADSGTRQNDASEISTSL